MFGRGGGLAGKLSRPSFCEKTAITVAPHMRCHSAILACLRGRNLELGSGVVYMFDIWRTERHPEGHRAALSNLLLSFSLLA